MTGVCKVHLELNMFAAIGPDAGALAVGSGGGDEPIPTSSKTSAMACRRSAADKMINFMRHFVSISYLWVSSWCLLCFVSKSKKFLLQMEKRDEE